MATAIGNCFNIGVREGKEKGAASCGLHHIRT